MAGSGVPAPVPPEDADRVRSLERYAVLDTEDEEAFDRITRLASGLLDMPIALVSLVDGERQWFKSKVGLEVTQTSREVAFCAYTILGDEVFTVPDTAVDERFAGNPLVTGDPRIRFYAGVPLTAADGSNLGSLCVIDREPRDLDARELAILVDLAGLAQRELELRRVAMSDGLTGVFNRDGLVAAAGRELVRAQSHGTTLCLAVLDLDHFKDINDTYGHAGGDAVLCSVADIIAANLRGVDIVGRLGGDEFALLLPGADEGQTRTIVDRIRGALAQSRRELVGAARDVTVSIGVAEFDPLTDDLPALFAKADKALYRAKRAGGDRVDVDAGKNQPGRE